MLRIFKTALKFLTKLVSLRTMIIVALVALVIFGIGIGLGIGNGKGDTEGNNDEIQATEEYSPQENTEAVFDGTVINVSVVGSEYIFDNSRIDIDSLVYKIKAVSGKTLIQIKDDNASKKAYDTLINRFRKEQINYVG